MIDRIAFALRSRPESPIEVKAATGIGAAYFANDPPLSLFQKNSPQKAMEEAQKVYVRNRWIRAAERAISHAFGTVPWHLADAKGEEVTDESPENLKAIRDLLEKPYRPGPKDPRTNTPRTRSGLWGITSRHIGLCGAAAWYLDQTEALAGTPLQILYLNPARLSPALDGGNLLGWVLDEKPGGGGVPLELDQVLLFTLEEPDEGVFPPGLVETAMSSTLITRTADRHAATSFAAGGKIPGVFSPRSDAGVMPADVFLQLEKDLRKANEDPDQTRRSVILRGPVEFTPTAATNEQLDLTAIEAMARDDVLNVWNVPLSQLGGSVAVGLEGSKKGFDEAVFWQKAVGPRLRRFDETVQFELLDRFQKLGIFVDLVITEPTFDDDDPLYDRAQKAMNLPLTNNERREMVGLDPFQDPAIGNAIVLPMQIVEYGTSVSSRPDDDVPLEGVQAKAKIDGFRAAAMKLLPRLRKDLGRFLEVQKKEIVGKVQKNEAHLKRRPGDAHVWWDGKAWDERLRKVLEPYARTIADLSASRAKDLLGSGKAAEFVDLAGNRSLQTLLRNLGGRITGINETTRLAVSDAIREGVLAGEGGGSIGDRIEDLTVAQFSEYRGELIARTETNRILNESSLLSYTEYGVEKVQAFDGDEWDDECRERDGQIFPIDEAMAIEDHPNGTLGWSPVIRDVAE